MAEDEGGGDDPRPGQTAHQAHVSAVARFNHEPVDLDGALDDMERLLQRVIQRQRDEVLRCETSKAGARNTSLSPEFYKGLKECTTAIASVVSARKSLWQTAKDRAGRMSPEERAEAMKAAVLKMPYLARRSFLLDLCRRHTSAHREAVASGAEKPLSDTQSPITLTMAEVA